MLAAEYAQKFVVAVLVHNVVRYGNVFRMVTVKIHYASTCSAVYAAHIVQNVVVCNTVFCPGIESKGRKLLVLISAFLFILVDAFVIVDLAILNADSI